MKGTMEHKVLKLQIVSEMGIITRLIIFDNSVDYYLGQKYICRM